MTGCCAICRGIVHTFFAAVQWMSCLLAAQRAEIKAVTGSIFSYNLILARKFLVGGFEAAVYAVALEIGYAGYSCGF